MSTNLVRHKVEIGSHGIFRVDRINFQGKFDAKIRSHNEKLLLWSNTRGSSNSQAKILKWGKKDSTK